MLFSPGVWADMPRVTTFGDSKSEYPERGSRDTSESDGSGHWALSDLRSTAGGEPEVEKNDDEDSRLWVMGRCISSMIGGSKQGGCGGFLFDRRHERANSGSVDGSILIGI